MTYAQQSKELANAEQDKLEKRIQEFRTQSEIDTLRVSSNIELSTNAGSIQVVGMNLDKSVEPLMLSSNEGEVSAWSSYLLLGLLFSYQYRVYFINVITWRNEVFFFILFAGPNNQTRIFIETF